MRVLSASEIRAWDAYTIEHEPISSVDLMERAATAALDNIPNEYLKGKTVLFLCGSGNNGGDGLVMARLLRERQPNVAIRIFLIEADNYTEDNLINQERLRSMGVSLEPLSQFVTSSWTDQYCVLDALLGTGFTGPLREGALKESIQKVNELEAFVISIDIPSGIDTDSGEPYPETIMANLTLSFEAVKLPLLLPKFEDYIGYWKVVPIGLDQKMPFDSKRHFLTRDNVPALQTRGKHSHKGNHGHALFVAGEMEMIGASILACKSALHTGLGLLTTWQPDQSNQDIQLAIPEAMACFENEIDWGKYSAIAIGPGLGKTDHALNKLKAVLRQKSPLIIDADAINLIAEHDLLDHVPQESILTPHPKELERLTGASASDRKQQLLAAERLSQNGLNIIVKGAYSILCLSNGETWFNSTGNASMAKGGMGDILTGLLLGLCAQGQDVHDVVKIAAYVHGDCGDDLMKREGVYYSVSDFVDTLSESFQKLDF